MYNFCWDKILNTWHQMQHKYFLHVWWEKIQYIKEVMFHYPLRRILQHLCPHSAPHRLVQFHLWVRVRYHHLVQFHLRVRVRYHHHKLMIIRMIHLDKMEVLLLQLIEIQLKKFLVKIMLKSKIPLCYIVITNGDLQKHHFHQHNVY